MNKGIQQVFTEVPKTYELINHILTFGMDIFWRKKAVKIAAERGGERWLDICSGTGETAAYLRRVAPKGTKVFSADFCEPMLKKAMEKPEGKNINFTLADANILPFKDESFDVVTISFATRNINVTNESLRQSLSEFHRVLKKGGRFINVETSQPRSNILRKLFHSYIKLFIRPIGEAISGSNAGYKYLSHTIPRFYGAEEFSGIIREAGFAKVDYKQMFFGISAIHVAEK